MTRNGRRYPLTSILRDHLCKVEISYFEAESSSECLKHMEVKLAAMYFPLMHTINTELHLASNFYSQVVEHIDKCQPFPS